MVGRTDSNFGLVFIVNQIEFDKTSCSCPRNSDQNCTQNSAGGGRVQVVVGRIDSKFCLVFVNQIEFDMTRWSCPWNSDQNCTQKLCQGGWCGVKGMVSSKGKECQSIVRDESSVYFNVTAVNRYDI